MLRAALLGLGLFLIASAFIEPIWVAAAQVSHSCILETGSERTECYEDTLPLLYPEYAVRDIFALITRIQDVDPALADCHFVAHALGERVVSDDPRRWPEHIRAELPESICAGGFMHGLTIAAYDHSGLTDAEIEKDIPLFRSACAGMRLNERLSCVHGVGHMLYYITGGDIRRSLRLCDAVMEDARMDESFNDARRCETGVVMMLVFSEIDPEWEPNQLYDLTRENVREFCASLEKPSHQGACLRGTWPLFPEAIETAENVAAFCSSQPDEHETEWCYAKLVLAATWMNLNDIPHLVGLCEDTAQEWRETCQTFVRREILAQKGLKALPRVVRFCDSFHEPARRACFDGLASESGRYTGEGMYPPRKEYCRALPREWRERCYAAEER
jgi:hypothetical protein